MKSLLLGLAVAAIIFAGLYWFGNRKARGKTVYGYSMECAFSIRKSPPASPSPSYDQLQIIRKRLESAGLEYDLDQTDELHYHLKTEATMDSGYVEKLLTQHGRFSIHEMYTLLELTPQILSADSLLALQYRWKLPPKPTDSVNLPVPTMVDSMGFYERPLISLVAFPAMSEHYMPSFIGWVVKADTARLNEFLQRSNMSGLFPEDLLFCYGADDDSNKVLLYAAKKNVAGTMSITEANITGAAMHNVTATKTLQFSLSLDKRGAKIFERLTRNNLHKPLGVLIDKKVITAPIVNEPISQGSLVINGLPIGTGLWMEDVLKGGRLYEPATIISKKITRAPLKHQPPARKRPLVLYALAAGLSFMLVFSVYFIFAQPKKNS